MEEAKRRPWGSAYASSIPNHETPLNMNSAAQSPNCAPAEPVQSYSRPWRHCRSTAVAGGGAGGVGGGVVAGS